MEPSGRQLGHWGRKCPWRGHWEPSPSSLTLFFLAPCEVKSFLHHHMLPAMMLCLTLVIESADHGLKYLKLWAKIILFSFDLIFFFFRYFVTARESWLTQYPSSSLPLCPSPLPFLVYTYHYFTFHFYEINFFSFYIWMGTCGNCLSVPGLCHLT